jgi:hypothetical protein
VGYHEGTLGFASAHGNQAIELPPTVGAVKDALQRALQQRASAR